MWGYFLTTVTPELFNDLKVQSGIIFARVLIDTAKELITVSNLGKGSLREVETAISTYMNKYGSKLKKTDEKK